MELNMTDPPKKMGYRKFPLVFTKKCKPSIDWRSPNSCPLAKKSTKKKKGRGKYKKKNYLKKPKGGGVKKKKAYKKVKRGKRGKKGRGKKKK